MPINLTTFSFNQLISFILVIMMPVCAFAALDKNLPPSVPAQKAEVNPCTPTASKNGKTPKPSQKSQESSEATPSDATQGGGSPEKLDRVEITGCAPKPKKKTPEHAVAEAFKAKEIQRSKRRKGPEPTRRGVDNYEDVKQNP